MRLKLWSISALLACVFGCGTTETSPQDTRGTAKRDAGSKTSGNADDSSDDDSSDDDEGDDGATTRRDAGTGTTRRDAGKAPEGCGQTNFKTQPLIPDMLIVLDRSASMRTGGIDRWAPSVAAVKSLTTTFQAQVAFGLMTFPYANDLCGPGQIQVPIGMNTGTQIGQILDRSSPQGGTPTGDTLHVALESFRATAPGPDDLPRTRYVLLMTDGQPTCPAARGTSGAIGSEADLAADKQLTIQALDQLAADNIKTFVVGYDAELDPTLAGALTEFAKHGQTERYYPVQDEKTLNKAFETISSAVISCTFTFEKTVDDPAYLRVLFDGKTLKKDEANGFTFEGDSVTLQGTPCDQLQERASHNIEIRLECTPVI